MWAGGSRTCRDVERYNAEPHGGERRFEPVALGVPRRDKHGRADLEEYSRNECEIEQRQVRLQGLRPILM